MSPPAPASVCEQGGLQEGVTLGEPGEQRGVTRSWGGSWGPVVMVWGLLRTQRERCHCRVLLSQLCKEHPRGTGKGRGGDVASGRAHGEGSPAESTEGASPALCRARQACGTAPVNAFFNCPNARVATAPTFATAAEMGTSISPLTQPQGHRWSLLTGYLGRGLGTNSTNIAGKKTITPCPGKVSAPRHASTAREGVLLSLSPKAEAVCSPRPGWEAAAGDG